MKNLAAGFNFNLSATSDDERAQHPHAAARSITDRPTILEVLEES